METIRRARDVYFGGKPDYSWRGDMLLMTMAMLREVVTGVHKKNARHSTNAPTDVLH